MITTSAIAGETEGKHENSQDNCVPLEYKSARVKDLSSIDLDL